MELSLFLNAAWKSNPSRTQISGEWLTGVGPQIRMKGSKSTSHPQLPSVPLDPIVLPLEVAKHIFLKKFSPLSSDRALSTEVNEQKQTAFAGQNPASPEKLNSSVSWA